MEHFFSPIQVETCNVMHTRVKLLEGMQMKSILKLLGGIQSNNWGARSPPPGVSAPLVPGPRAQIVGVFLVFTPLPDPRL